MRLWSIHPVYLDSKGLIALWREALLAQKVLLGETNGYKHHPQLLRFRKTRNPVGAIASYLRCVFYEAESRGYCFDKSKIVNRKFIGKIPVTNGQLEYEFQHLLCKLKKRNHEQYMRLINIEQIKVHPVFYKIAGDVEDWEIRQD